MISLMQGDALTKLQTLETESVDCCITSPPYWALRDYKVNGQLGLESTFQEYINKLVTIFDEVKRVLKKTGSCWVVIGDTYSGSGGAIGKTDTGKLGISVDNYGSIAPRTHLPGKSLCMIPERFSIAMLDDDRGDDYELNDDAPVWVKQELERVLSDKQLYRYVEACPSRIPTSVDNTILNIQRNGEMNIGKDSGSE